MNIKCIILIGLMVVILVACASPATTQLKVAQPTATQPESTQLAIANPASQNCVDKGGSLSFEERRDGGQFGIPG